MSGPRVLMVGTVNSPHLQHLADALRPALGGVAFAGWQSPAVPAVDVPAALAPRRALSPAGRPLLAAWLARAVRALAPDVVHVHGVSEFAAAAALVRARPLLLTAYGSDLLAPARGSDRRARFALRRTDAVTADSPRLLERAVELAGPRPAAHRLGWGVDLERFRPGDAATAQRRLGLPPGRYVLSPRALAPLYNPVLVVAAFDRLADEDPQLRLLVKHLGGAQEPPPSRHPDRVHVVGHLPYERLPDVLAAAAVCVSVPSSDSGPRTVWEAMACGVPCVLSDLPWLDGMVERETEALVVPLDPAALARAIRRLLDDGSLARGLAARARARVALDHDAREHRRLWLQLYRDLASARPTASR